MIKIGHIELPNEQPKTNNLDRPGVAKLLNNAPSDYIIVNDPNLLLSAKENSCVILFDWTNFIDKIIGTNVSTGDKSKSEFKSAIDGIVKELTKEKNSNYQSDEEILNREINKSLLEFRTSIDTNLGSSSCSFSLENFDDKWIVKDKNNLFYGQSIIQEGIRFIIDAKGRFNSDIFYRIWTGYVTGIVETSNPTDRRLSFSSLDSSRVLSYTRWNVFPAIFETDLVAKQLPPSIFSSNIQGKDGSVIFEDLTTFAKKTEAKYELAIQEEWVNIGEVTLKDGKKKKGLDSDKDGIVDTNYNSNYHYGYNKSTLTSYKFRPNPQTYRLVWGHVGTPYTQLFGNLSLYFSEFRTRKDVLSDLASITFFKIYIDPAGHIHYHPPRFEEEHYLAVKDEVTGATENSLVHCIFDDEVISQSYSQNEGEICTVARGLQEGGFGIFKTIEQNVRPNTYQSTIIWEDGINRFGFRERKVSTGAIKGPQEDIDTFTAAFLLRANQERYQMTVTIPMRPEMQIDRPLYDYNKDKVYYIRNISHNFSAGGPNSGGAFTTTVVCNAGRRTNEKISSNILSTAGQYKTIKDMRGESSNIQKFTTLNIRDLRSETQASAKKLQTAETEAQKSSLQSSKEKIINSTKGT